MIQNRLDTTHVDCEFTSLADLLRVRAETAGDELAYQFLIDGKTEGARLTYAELLAGADAISVQLLTVANRGDRALLLYPPGTEFLTAFFGCLQAGIIAIPLSPPDTSRMKRALPRLAAVAGDAQASLVLTTSDIHAALKSHVTDTQETRELSWVDTDEIIGNGRRPAKQPTWQASVDDMAFLQYTSGSTSAPKGVIVSHGNVLSQCQALTLASGYTPTSIVATWMPYFHDYGLIEGLLVPLYIGATCYVMSPLAFIKRPIRWLEAISRYRVTHSHGPNFAYDRCVRKTTVEQRADLDLSCWVSAANGAESVRASTLRSFYETFKECGLSRACISPVYGLAESTLGVSVTPPHEEAVLFEVDVQAYERGRLEAASAGRSSKTIVSSGRLLTETKVEIVDPDTCKRCSQDEVGEVWVASPSVSYLSIQD
jgi:acyl-CoA synthetase (AMP-forming)/AMP-acid ligase II